MMNTKNAIMQGLKVSLVVGMTLAVFGLGKPAFSESSLPVSMEWLGIEQILKTLGPINPVQADSLSNQSILDILDLKGQVEAKKPTLQSAIVSPAAHPAMKRPTLHRKVF